jgi:inhibitor of KinA sporulation pathway (predicted exonuclease)
MKYIVFDLEATCWKTHDHSPNEIIEIGAVCIDDKKQTLGEFCTFIKPVIHPILSDFCTELTSITQDMIQDAPHFPEAVGKFQEWIASFEDEYWLCSWGFYDKSQFKKDCELHQQDTKWLKKHISVKHQYGTIIGKEKGIGMDSALQREGFTLTGTHHRGLDDAKNIASRSLRTLFLSKYLYKNGFFSFILLEKYN